MSKHLLVALCCLFSFSLFAQLRIQERLTWEEPLTVEWSGERRVQLTYTTSDATRRSGQLPSFIHTSSVSSGQAYEVEVVNAELENFLPPSGFDGTDAAESLNFTATTTSQPGGYLLKVSGPTIIRSASSFQRLTAIDLRLVPTASSTGGGRSVDFANNSVLREGEIYRFAIAQNGVYKLTRAFLADQLQVTGLDQLDPRDLKIYGQVGGMLPETNNIEAPDDLTEQAIAIEGEGDGSFDGGDYILLYAEGADGRRYDEVTDRFVYTKNIYDDKNYYYLVVGTAGRGRRLGELPSAGGGPVLDSYDWLGRYEEDKFNVLHELTGNSHGSGKTWFGDFFKVNREEDYSDRFAIPDAVTEEPLRIRARMGLRTSDVSSRYFADINGQELSSFSAGSVRFGAQEQSRAVIPTELAGTAELTGDRIDLTIRYPFPAGAGQSEAWLDWIQLRARRRLSFSGLNQFNFRDVTTREEPTITFRFVDTPGDLRVWRVDDGDVRRASIDGQTFSAPAGGQLFEYVAFRAEADLLTPEAIGRVDNQNLHAIDRADMIIVTHPDFAAQAEQLAEHRRSHNGYVVQVVNTEQIYHEFSSGREDAAAIRNFVRMVHERDPQFRFLLLFGDGSFDQRDIYGLGNNQIPVFQHEGGFTEVNSFPADDFYAIFNDAAAGQPLAPDVNINIGRLPVKTASEAEPVVEKLVRYDLDPSTLGDWRTRMVFVGDDEDRGQHTRDVNRVANLLEARKPDLNFDKLYFDLFPQQSLSAGDRYPDITEGLDRAVFRGALAVTYLGHGGPRGWAQERVLTIPQIRNWRRPEGAPDPIQPPLFITATCTFSNYDDASFVSAGEEALLTPRGGVIALMTTTRPVFATRNFELTANTVAAMAERPDGAWRSLGEIIRIAKNQTTPADNSTRLASDTENARKYTLLGDPATVVAFPIQEVITTMIDSLPVDSTRSDTARALQRVRISGEIVDVSGNRMDNFNGQVFPTIYDKPQTVSTLQQDASSPKLDIEVQRNIIFRGRATVSAGRFTFEFVVPEDIDYTFGPSKISYYAADPTNFTDAAGFYDRLIVGGTLDNAVANDEGPEVELFMDDTDFVSGGQTGKDPVLLVHLSDDLGINVTGNSIGHDLEAVLDEDTRNTFVLNDFYEADVDNFRSGKVRFPLFDIEPGLHKISVRAWDVANNSTVAETEFLVASDINNAITRIFNYPNPFTTNTCFQFDHTLVGQAVEAIVQIYTVNGRLVKTITRDYPFSDGTVRQDDCIEWDGLDDYGDELARGVYLYQVRLRGDGVNTVNGELGKLVLLR